MSRRFLASLLAGGLCLASCGQDDKPSPTAAPTAPASRADKPAATAAPSPSSAPAGTDGDVGKGKQVWLAQCVACHNADPTRDGTIGPAVKGSTRDLLEARVLHATYPPGYHPKRETKIMPPRPDLASSIPDLAAYLH